MAPTVPHPDQRPQPPPRLGGRGRLEIDFNDIRTTLVAYAITTMNSLHTNAYDEAITTPALGRRGRLKHRGKRAPRHGHRVARRAPNGCHGQ